MAQSRRFDGQNRVAGDYSHDDFWGGESIPEVGGAYLFETPRSGVRKMPKFPDSIDRTSDDDDHYDSGAYKPKNTNNARYKPNTSRRRCPRAGTTMTSLNHVESTRPIGKPRNDWREIRDLSHALLFETLQLVLILSMTIVRVSMALAESVARWLDERMPEVGTKEWSREEVDSFEGSRDEERAIEDHKEGCAGVEEDDDDKKTEDNEGKTHQQKHYHPQEDEDHSHQEDCSQEKNLHQKDEAYPQEKDQRPSTTMVDTTLTLESSTNSSNPLQ